MELDVQHVIAVVLMLLVDWVFKIGGEHPYKSVSLLARPTPRMLVLT